MLSNHPNTLGGGSTSSGGGESGVFTNVLVGNGSAAAPSYSFIGDTTVGFYHFATDSIGIASHGVAAGQMFADSNTTGGLRIVAATSGGSAAQLKLGSTGFISLLADGTNQSITLTPSGSGIVQTFCDLTNGGGVVAWSGSAANSNGFIKLLQSGSSGAILGADSGGTQYLVLSTAAGAANKIGPGHLLLGGQTTDGTGVLQLPAATTSAGGITFGTDLNFYRNAAGQATLLTSGTVALLLSDAGFTATLKSNSFSSNGGLTISAGGANSLVLNTNSATAITLDSSQNQFQSGTTTVYHGAATGAANSQTKLLKSVTAIANNTATDILTVTIPNTANSGRLHVELAGSLGAGGAIGANEATGVITYDFSITRTAGVATVTTASSAYGSATSSVAGAATITITAAATGMTGAVGATQTFTVQATIARGSGSSTNHACQIVAEVLNANASGITIA